MRVDSETTANYTFTCIKKMCKEPPAGDVGISKKDRPADENVMEQRSLMSRKLFRLEPDWI